MGFSLSDVTGSVFDGGLGQALGAVVGLGSDLIGTGINAYANHREADLNRNWQERMAKNAYQYRVADLRAAGLNPVLATGQNVSVPSGATAQGNPASMANAGRLMNTMLETSMKKSAAVADSQIAANNANAAKAQADASKAFADEELSLAQAAKTRKETSQIPSLSQEEVDNEFKGKNAPWYEYHARRIYGVMAGMADVANPYETAERLARAQVLLERTKNSANASEIRMSAKEQEIRVKALTQAILREGQQRAGKKWVDETKHGVGVKHPTGRSVLY